MKKDNQDKELSNKVIDLCLIQSIKESEIYLNILDNQIKFYTRKIEFLNNNKPLFFQKKKIREHNNKINDYYNKIFNCYVEIEKATDEFSKLFNYDDKKV